MPINFSNFLSDFFDDDALLPSFAKVGVEKCPKCGLTYNEFVNNGKFGCGECYNAFSDRLDAILKNLHGSYKHTGRAPKNIVKEIDIQKQEKQTKKVDEKQEKIDKLNKDLQKAIKEEAI